MAIQKIFLGTTTGDKTGDGAKIAGEKINAAFDYLENKIDSKDRVLVSTGFTQVGSVMTINAGWQWMINGITYTNPVAVEITFPLAETGLERIDNVVATTSNTFMRITGVEAVTPIAPLYQSGTVIISFSVINDAEVTEPDTPINNTDYVLKSEQKYTPINLSGVLLKVGKKSSDTAINFIGAATVVGSLEVKPQYFNRLFDGVIYTIKNSQAVDIVYNHLSGTGNVLFSFPTATNFTLKPNEIFQCKLRITSWNTAVFDYIGVASSGGGVELPIAIADVTGLTAELDSKLDISDYNNHFKSVYLTEAALFAAHPTASVGDYAQVNEVGSTDVVNYNWDAEENIWVKNAVAGSGATNTDALPEGTSNLYFQTARVLATLLTGISFVTGGAIVSTDSVLVAFGKIQKQMSDFNTTANIKTLLGITTLSGSNTGDETTASLKTKINEELGFACSDESSVLTTGLKVTFRMPFAMVLSEVRISLGTAATIGSFIVDVKQNGTSIFSTLVSIDAAELTSTTAFVPAVLSTTALIDDSLMTIHVTQIGSGDSGKGLKLLLIGKKS